MENLGNFDLSVVGLWGPGDTLAQLNERPSAKREAAGSTPCQSNTQGLVFISEEEVLLL